MSKRLTVLFFLSAVLLAGVFTASAQVTAKYRYVNNRRIEVTEPEPATDSVAALRVLEIDTLLDVSAQSFPSYFFMPAVFDTYDLRLRPDTLGSTIADGPLAWASNRVKLNRRMRQIKQQTMMENPRAVRYNIFTLPEAPKAYRTYVDPNSAKITVEEIPINAGEVHDNVRPADVRRIYWLKDFTGLVQFSQAYNSPNWYQGGNNNLNMIVNAIYNVKLNQKFKPNLLFETTASYKLAMNSAPEDSLRNYSISEDLLQINSKFGIKATKRWYYSATLQFKTQLLTNYVKNTRDVTASFLSPGELNLGLGMTYSYETPSKKLSLNTSVAPLSYNLKICTNDKIDETSLGIKEGHTTAGQIGSNIDCKLVWNLTYNITYNSRLTAFTDYSYLQADWEHTLSFNINRFLSTQIYVHMRYDTQSPRIDDSRWHKFQLKEILSFGFSYTFKTA